MRMGKPAVRSVVVVVAGACVLIAATALAFNTTPPKAPIVIKGCKDKKAPVPFDHPMHVKGMEKEKQTCTACHHQIKGKPPAKNRCSECHATKQSDKIGTCKDASLTKNPFHQLCRGCHQKMKTAHPKAPTACGGCHKQ